MTMLTIGFRRGVAAALAGAVLLVGALACAATDTAATDSLTANLDDAKRMSQDNYVALEVYGKRIDRLEQENAQLSERIAQQDEDNARLSERTAQLEQENTRLSGRVVQLEAGKQELLDAMNSMALGGGMASQTNEPLTRDTATDEQRAMVRRWVECGIPENLVAMIADQAESETWMQIETGAMTIAEVELSLPVLCEGRSQ